MVLAIDLSNRSIVARIYYETPSTNNNDNNDRHHHDNKQPEQQSNPYPKSQVDKQILSTFTPHSHIFISIHLISNQYKKKYY